MVQIPDNLKDTQIIKRVHIRPNELRLGNFAYTNTEGKMCGICFRAVQIKNWAKQYIDSLEPIPISAEWLEWLGFEKSEGKWRIGDNGYIVDYVDIVVYGERVIAWGILQEYYIEELDKSVPIVIGYELKYIHELQNMIFALTGEELKPKK